MTPDPRPRRCRGRRRDWAGEWALWVLSVGVPFLPLFYAYFYQLGGQP